MKRDQAVQGGHTIGVVVCSVYLCIDTRGTITDLLEAAALL